MRILITGAAGFIGSHLAQRLSPGNQLFLLDRNDAPVKIENAEWLCHDLTKRLLPEQLPQAIDVIFHFAESSRYHDFPSAALEIFQLNTFCPLQLLEYGRVAGASKFFYASTGNVYDEHKEKFRETDKVSGMRSFYALSKFQGEGLVRAYSSYMSTGIFRFFAVYGPGQKRRLISTLVEKVLTSQPIQIYGKQGIRLNPIYIDDAVEVMAKAVSLDESVVLNVGGIEELSILQMSKAIGEVACIGPRFEHLPDRGDADLVGEVGRMMEVLDFRPGTMFDEGVRRILKVQRIRK